MIHRLTGTCLGRPYQIVLMGPKEGFVLSDLQEFRVLSNLGAEAYQHDHSCWLVWDEGRLRLQVRDSCLN